MAFNVYHFLIYYRYLEGLRSLFVSKMPFKGFLGVILGTPKCIRSVPSNMTIAITETCGKFGTIRTRAK